MIEISIDTKPIERLLGDFRRQLPFISVTAVNDLAFDVMRMERENIGETLEHPRPFTQNGVVVDKARKGSPVATVRLRAEVNQYLRPYEFGGLHHLPGKGLLNPVNVSLDAYGQLRKGQVKRLIERPNVFGGSIKRNGREIGGIWQRSARPSRGANVKRGAARAAKLGLTSGGSLKLLIRFGDALPVHKRLGFGAKADAFVRANAGGAFGRAIEKALATARPPMR